MSDNYRNSSSDSMECDTSNERNGTLSNGFGHSFSDSDLLCDEDSSSIFGSRECDAAYENDFSHRLDNHASYSDFQEPNFNNNGPDSFVSFPLQDEEEVRRMVETEREYCPADGYLRRMRSGELNLNARRVALGWIWKAHSIWRFGPLSFILATNYFDRFLSIHDLSSEAEWAYQLLALACLSIATKLEECIVPDYFHLQVGKPQILFERKSIQSMELLVLSTLRWRMRAFTPCSFIEYFLCKLNNGQYPSMAYLSTSVQLIVLTTKGLQFTLSASAALVYFVGFLFVLMIPGSAVWELNAGIDFLEFRPSEIAAAVAIYISGEHQRLETDIFMSYFVIVEKGRVVRCLEMIQDMSPGNGCTHMVREPSPLVRQSPAGILDDTDLSFRVMNELLCLAQTPNHNSPDDEKN